MRFKKEIAWIAAVFAVWTGAAAAFLFLTGAGHQLRTVAAESVLSSQHRQWARFTLLPKNELDAILGQITAPKYVNSEPATPGETIVVADSPVAPPVPSATPTPAPTPANDRLSVSVETIEVSRGSYFFKGKLMTVSNPLAVKLVSSQKTNWGEQINVLSDRARAIGAINASGFNDPNGVGNGGVTVGIAIEDGKIKNAPENNPDQKDYVGALTADGKLITGFYSANELLRLNAKYAAGFKPQLIVNGNKMVEGDGGWGIGPRTAIGQKADGTILLLVIDGRQPARSVGATIKDVQDILHEKGAVNAICMDGGSSAAMQFNRQLITVPSSVGHIPRYLPNAWVVVSDGMKSVGATSDGKPVALR